MSSKECLLQQISQNSLRPFTSIQLNNITIDPKIFSDPYCLHLLDYRPGTNSDPELILLRLCDKCNLCEPLIRSTPTRIEIDRDGYVYNPDINDDRSAFYKKTYIPEGKSNAKIAIVEDSPILAFRYAEKFQNSGYYVVVYIVQPRTIPFSLTETKEMVDILTSSHFQAVIIDKGIGPLSGLDLAKDIYSRRLDGHATPKTIMISGEPETDESHRAMPDVFFEKGAIPFEDILEAVNTPFVIRSS